MQRVSTSRKRFTSADGRDFQVSCFTVSGTRPGPVLTVIAGQHGMEHSGPNLLPEFIEELTESDFAGTVHVCPCANPLALEIDYEFYPEHEDISRIKDYYYSMFRHYHCPWGFGRGDGETLYNMNRLWNHPDSPGAAGQVAAWLWKEICASANVIIDMHSLQAEKPVIFNNREKCLPIVRYFGAEAVMMRDPAPNAYRGGNLTWQGGMAANQYAFCIEFSRQHGLKESEYEWGKQGIRNVMAGINMTDAEIILSKPLWKVFHKNSGQVVRAGAAGHIRYKKQLYDFVRKGDPIYEIRDLQTIEVMESVTAPNDGVICNISHLPVMKPHDQVCWVAEAEQIASPGIPLDKLPRDFFQQ